MTRSPRLNKIMTEAICFLQVLVFMYTGCSKLWDQQNFTAQMAINIPVPAIVNVIAWAIPVAEIIIAILLAIPATRLKASFAFLYLMAIFTAYIIFLLLASPSLPCSCGGVVAALTWKQHLVFNGILIILSIAGIHLHEKQRPFNNSRASTINSTARQRRVML